MRVAMALGSDGYTEGWIAHIPEPSTAGLLVAAGQGKASPWA